MPDLSNSTKNQTGMNQFYHNDTAYMANTMNVDLHTDSSFVAEAQQKARPPTLHSQAKYSSLSTLHAFIRGSKHQDLS